VVVVLGVIGAALVPVPYYALHPGKVRPTADLVLVEGGPDFPPDSPVAFTTVNLRELSLLEAAAAWLDPDVAVMPEEEIRGNQTKEENRQLNLQLMDTSKQVAITVALRELGYDVVIRTAGTIVAEPPLPDTPAEGVLEEWDVIVEVDGEPVDQPGEIGDLLQVGGVGATHRLVIERGPRPRTIRRQITTVASPDDPDRAMIGILTSERIVDFEYPFPVDIDAGSVGGPSAGLAFTLAVLDHLTPGELTGGTQVAVTGTIELDGTVGPIGGIAQKAVAVRDRGYEVFVVPDVLAPVVRDKVEDDLQVIGVANLDEALEALASLGGNALALGRPGDDRPGA
jgi:Lon-like protease